MNWMNKLRRPVLSVGIFLFLSGHFSFADEQAEMTKQTLLEISTDLNDHIYDIALILDPAEKVIQAQVDQTLYPVESFVAEIRQNMVLSESHGMPVVSLGGERDFDTERGGELRLRYLTRPIIRSYRSLIFTLEKNEDQWNILMEDENQEKIIIKRLHVITRKFFGIPIGISRVVINP